jgi:hypothetical protein
MRKDLGLVAVLLVLMCTFAFALTDMDLVWNGTANINLTKDSFSDSEPITGTITINNLESFPIVGGKFVLQLAEGEYIYPSQSAITDNVFLEKIVDFDWVLPLSQKEIPFSISPQKSGSYRIDAYAWISKSKFIGASNILYNPISKAFTVTGNSSVQRAQIFRLPTTFERYSGPVGFPIQEGTKFNGEIVINNPSSQAKNNLKIGLTLCEWASPFCEGKESLFDVPSIQAKTTLAVSVNLTAPSVPSAYEINIVLYNGSEIESIYKSRVIVSGGTAKARKVFINGLDTKNYSIGIITAGSPDHFNYPDFNNFNIAVTVFDGNNGEETKSVDINSIGTRDMIRNDFALDSKSFNKLCVTITKSGNTFDKQCFNVPLLEIQAAYDAEHPKLVQVSYTYNDSTGALSIKLNKSGESINARMRLFKSEATILEENVNANEAFEKTLWVGKENLLLTVDDFDAKEQIVLALNFAVAPSDRNQAIIGESLSGEYNALPECTFKVCETGSVCRTSGYDSRQGTCCPSDCISPITSESEANLFSIPLILWVAIVFAIIAIISAFSAVKSVRRK